MQVNLPKLICSKCGYKWIPKKEQVFLCPECKAPLEKYPPKKVEGENDG